MTKPYKKTSVSDPDPVGSGYFGKLGSGSGLNTRIPDLDPGSTMILNFIFC